MLIHLENYRNIPCLDYEIEDGKVNFLYGVCGSGKSSIISAIHKEGSCSDVTVGKNKEEMSILINGQEGPLDDVRVYDSDEQTTLFQETSANIYDIFIGNESDLRDLEADFRDSVDKLRSKYETFYAFQGRIRDLQKTLGKPRAKGNFAINSKISKLAAALQCSTPFIESALDKGGVQYATWLNDGLSITSDFEKGVCPFCSGAIKQERKNELSELDRLKTVDLKPLFEKPDLLASFDIDLSLLKTEEGSAEVKDKIADLYKVSREVDKIIDFCNLTGESLMDNEIPMLSIESVVYIYFPELKNIVAEVQRQADSIRRLLGKMKETFCHLVNENAAGINNELKRLSIPYVINLYKANHDKHEAQYVLKHVDDSSSNDRRGQLSTGEKNLISLILFLQEKSNNVLLIDDPASSFDDFRRTQIFELILHNTDSTVLVVSHDQAFIRRAVRQKKMSGKRVGKIQAIYQARGVCHVEEIDETDIVFLPDKIKDTIEQTSSYRRKAINLRLLCDCRKNTVGDNVWQYSSMILHHESKQKIDEQLRSNGTSEEKVLDEIEEKLGIFLPPYEASNVEVDDSLSDFEKLIELRESLEEGQIANRTTKDMLNDLVHMNDACLYCLDPYKFHVWSPSLTNMLAE